MKTIAFLASVSFCLAGFSLKPIAYATDDHVEFICMKKKLSTKTCHYNFVIDGARYRYVDIGCKFKERQDVIKRAKSGRLALARDWEIECPEAGQSNSSDRR
ncbi:MAG TPA: hypothetical protein VIH22_05330 [Cyclobacteriaceae bacterium]|jgi:hypothetical protein